MTRFDDAVDQATKRLRADPELRLEVRQELLSHLEDSESEFLRAGYDAASAEQEALRAFGDPQQLSHELLRANLRRMNVRRAVRWALGAAGAPAAAVVAVAAAWPAVVTALLAISMLSMFTSGVIQSPPALTEQLWNRTEQAQLATLSPQQRALFTGGRGDATWNWHADTQQRIASSRALAERYPDDAMLHADYIMQLLTAFFSTGRNQYNLPPDIQQELIAAAARGRELEPDNAWYPLIEAGALLISAGAVRDEPDEQKQSLRITSWHRVDELLVGPDAEPSRFDRTEVHDPASFQRGIALLQEAANKPYLQTHALALAERRLQMLPEPTSLAEQLYRFMFRFGAGTKRRRRGGALFSRWRCCSGWCCGLNAASGPRWAGSHHRRMRMPVSRLRLRSH